MTTVSDSLQPPRRSVRLSTKPLISTYIEERESNKENSMSSEHVHKIENDIDYSVESKTEEEEEDHRKCLATQDKPVSNLILWLHMSL